MIKLFLAPMLTVFISSALLFTIVGPLGRELAEGITSTLLWITQNLGIFGFMFFAGIQQIIVITGLHHVIGAVEAQLLTDTGKNFINPLMSVALTGQGGAVLGYVYLKRKDNKVKQIGISAFGSTLFGVSEPAIFGVTLKYKFPLIAGCIGGALAGGYVYLSNLTAIGFGTTALPGLAIAAAENNGHLHYLIAHLIALTAGAALTFLYGKIRKK
ncbi:PTS transporter subunit EIIC [Bacillus sp. WMMC1349]|nr:PTS transporter subunit EIIC [Bacillus sp. WMMC1349]